LDTAKGSERVKREQIETLLERDKGLRKLGITSFTMVKVYNPAKERVKQAELEWTHGIEVASQLPKPADREDESFHQEPIVSTGLEVPSGETKASSSREAMSMGTR
jgi:hypothetical protein